MASTSTILLVEDDPGHAALVRRALRSCDGGYRVEWAESLAEARAKCTEIEPDLALVDMNLPDGSGLELLAVPLRGEGFLPVVIMTSQGSEAVAVEAMRRGALDYAVKGGRFTEHLPLVVARALRERRNVRERRRAEETARRLGEQYRLLYDDTPAMFFTVDDDGGLVSANRFGAERLGYRPEELVGTPLSELHEDDSPEELIDWLRFDDIDVASVRRREARKRRRDGSTFWSRDTARRIVDAHGRSLTLMVSEDVTETRERQSALEHAANHDVLTGLVNRREFFRRLERTLESLCETPGEHLLCFLDLDRFKAVNDTCGHEAGDELLRVVTAALRGQMRQRDTLARLGGDEFAVLMEHCPVARGAVRAEALRGCIDALRFEWGSRQFRVGVSVGLISFDDPGATPESLLREADAACYSAKRGGRNRVEMLANVV